VLVVYKGSLKFSNHKILTAHTLQFVYSLPD